MQTVRGSHSSKSSPAAPQRGPGSHRATSSRASPTSLLTDVDAVQLAISMLPPSTVTKVDYIRGGQPATTSVTLAKLAVAGKKIASVRPDAWRGIRVDYATALEAVELTQASSGAPSIPKAASWSPKSKKKALPGTPACERGCLSATWAANA